jgi:hypothetical protein
MPTGSPYTLPLETRYRSALAPLIRFPVVSRLFVSSWSYSKKTNTSTIQQSNPRSASYSAGPRFSYRTGTQYIYEYFTIMLSFSGQMFVTAFIHQWLYSPFFEPWPLLQFRNLFYTDSRSLWKGDQPVSRPLPTHTTTQTQIHALSGIQTRDPSVGASEDSS